MAQAASQNNGGAANLRPWKPGQSGNPGGRPKGLAAKVRDLAPAEDLALWKWAIWTRHEPTLEKLGIALDEVTLTEREKAHEWLAERGHGKAPAFAPIEGENPLDLSDVDGAIGAALDELAGRRETQAARDGTEPDLAEGSQARAATA